MITVVKSPAVRLLHVSDVHRYLHLNHDEEHNFLEGLIDVGTAWVEHYTGRSLLIKHYQFEGLWQFSRRGYIVSLPFPPLCEIIHLSSKIRFHIQKRHSLAVIRSETFTGISEGDSVTIDYTAGYGTLPSYVPHPLRHAVCIVIADLYKSRGSEPITHIDTLYRLLAPFRVLSL